MLDVLPVIQQAPMKQCQSTEGNTEGVIAVRYNIGFLTGLDFRSYYILGHQKQTFAIRRTYFYRLVPFLSPNQEYQSTDTFKTQNFLVFILHSTKHVDYTLKFVTR